jgi:NADPH2:quinone reductase
MRAVVIDAIGPAEALTVQEVARPVAGEGEALVRVAYCALNPMDGHARSGRMRWGVPPFPFTLGYEYAGRVEAVGTGVDPAVVGQRVSVIGGWGGLADFAIAPAARLRPIPDRIGWQLGTVYLSTTAAAWHALHTVAHLEPEETVAIHSAAGAVGIMATQIAKDAGARVIGLVGSAEKIAWAEPFGADALIDYGSADWPARVRTMGGERGVDVVIDGVQGPNAAHNLDILAPLGRIVYLGAAAGPAADIAIPQLIARSASIAGLVVYEAMAKTKGRELPLFEEKLASGAWRYPLNPPKPVEAVAQAFTDFEARRLMGRTIFEVGGEL